MKIPNIFPTNNVVISQGGHDQRWDNQYMGKIAIDFAIIDPLLTPFDGCEVITYSTSFPANVRQSYFGLKLPNGDIIVAVHAKPVKMGKVNKGEPWAWCTWHHYHLFLIVRGQGENILNYLDRTVSLSTQASLYGGDSHHPDCDWSNYSDKQLNIDLVDVVEEAKIIAQVESVKAEPAKEFSVTSETPGISYVLKNLGLSDEAAATRWIWETVGQANGFRPSDFDKYNAQLKVGDVVRVPTRLLPAQSTAVEIPVKIVTPVPSPVPSPVEVIPVEIDQFGKASNAVNEGAGPTETKTEISLQATKDVNQKWDLQTFLVGATKNLVNTGSIQALLGGGIAIAVVLVPELESVQNELLTVLTVLFGLVVGGQNYQSTTKVL